MMGITATAFVMMSSPAPGGSEQLRFRAETLLFTTIVTSTLLIIIFTLAITRCRNIDKMLDKLIRQNSMNPASTKEGLLRLGKTGGKLNILYRQIDEISRNRGLKISALSNALELFSFYLSPPLILTDMSGKIVQVSRGWTEEFNGSSSNPKGSNIDGLFSGINISDIISRLEKTHLPATTEFKGKTFNWSIVYNRKLTPAYLIVMPAEVYKSRPN